MENSLSLNILLIDDEEHARNSIKCQLFWALLEDFNKLKSPWERFEYIENYKSIIFQNAIDLKDVLSILENQNNFDLITIDWNIGIDWKESGIHVVKHLEENHPELLKKTVAISWDEHYINYVENKFQVKWFKKGMFPEDKKIFNDYINDIIKNRL